MCSFSISCIPHYMFKKEILISGWKKSLNCGLPMISWYLAQAPLNFEAHFLISTLTVAALRYYFFLLSPKFHFAHSLYYFLLMKEKIIDLVFQNVKWEFVIGKEEHLKRNYEWIILMSLYGAWEICHLLMKPSWNHFSVFIIHITFFWTNFNAHCFCCKGKQSCTSFFPKGIGYVQICCWILFIILLYFCLRDIKYVSS